MIVITFFRDDFERYLQPGDSFELKINDELGGKTLLSEKINISKKINYVASFRFADEQGNCVGFHLSGIFGIKDELPVEIANAKHINDLTKEQLTNFCNSLGIEIPTKNYGTDS